VPLEDLLALEKAVAGTTTLKNILDSDWFRTVEASIKRGDSQPDPTGVLDDFSHALRGFPWFEEIQQLALDGRHDEIGDEGLCAIGLAGLDPLKVFLPELDKRLTAFSNLSIRGDAVEAKMAELKTKRLHPSLRNHLFELSVLGDLALKGVLVDIDEEVTHVDGVIRIERRDILVEATKTVQEVIPHANRVSCSDPALEVDQVAKKLRKKATEGRQLALANGKPTVLFLARTYYGAGAEMARIAVEECFASPDFAALSGVVVADTWRLFKTTWYPGQRPDVPLSNNETDVLASWYAS